MGFKIKGGFTLLEFLVAFAILGIISVIVGSIYLTHFRIFSNQNTAIDVSTQNKIALEEITTQIRQSQSIVSTCTLCADDTTSATVLVLRLWPIDSAGEPLDPGTGTNYDYIVFKRDAMDNKKLLKITYPYSSSTRPPGTHIVAVSLSALQFAYDNGDPTLASEVSVTVTTTANSLNRAQTTTDMSKVILRNK